MIITEDSVGVIFGASSGVGNAALNRLAPLVKKIYALSRRDMQADGKPSNVTSIQCDVQEYEQVESAFRHITLEAQVDFIINTVGVGFYAPITGNYSAYWEIIFRTNVIGLLNVLSNTYRYSKNCKHFIYVSSLAAHRPSGTLGNIVYSSSKVAAIPIINHFRKILREQNCFMKITMITPGYIEDTNFATDFFQSEPEKAHNLFDRFECLRADDVAKIMVDALFTTQTVEINEIIIRPREQPD